MKSTSQIGSFKIIGESSIGAGLRRIEAITGTSALNYFMNADKTLNQIAGILKTHASEVVDSVHKIIDNEKSLEKQLSNLQQKSASSAASDLASKAEDIAGVKLIASKVSAGSIDILSSMSDTLSGLIKSGIIVLAAEIDNKVAIVCKVSEDLVKQGYHAGNMIKEIAKVTGGGGGGRPDFAKAGGKDSSKIDEALIKAKELIESNSSK